MTSLPLLRSARFLGEMEKVVPWNGDDGQYPCRGLKWRYSVVDSSHKCMTEILPRIKRNGLFRLNRHAGKLAFWPFLLSVCFSVGWPTDHPYVNYRGVEVDLAVDKVSNFFLE